MTPNTYPVWSYLVYVAISVGSTVWVARTLHRNGRIFLVDAFHGNQPLADSVNHLLVVGFYLINIGYVTLALKFSQMPVDMQTAIELLSTKIGLVLLVLGGMHFMNMIVFSRLRRRAMRDVAPPPVPPPARIPVRAWAAVRSLTLLYDARCGLCSNARRWLEGQAQIVPLELLAADSAEARRRYPTLAATEPEVWWW